MGGVSYKDINLIRFYKEIDWKVLLREIFRFDQNQIDKSVLNPKNVKKRKN